MGEVFWGERKVPMPPHVIATTIPFILVILFLAKLQFCDY